MPKAEEIHYLIYTQKSPAPQWKEKNLLEALHPNLNPCPRHSWS